LISGTLDQIAFVGEHSRDDLPAVLATSPSRDESDFKKPRPKALILIADSINEGLILSFESGGGNSSRLPVCLALEGWCSRFRVWFWLWLLKQVAALFSEHPRDDLRRCRPPRQLGVREDGIP
jgi:hypothetical protein